MTKTETSPFVDRLLSWSLRRALPSQIQFLITTVLIAAVAVFRALVIASIVPWLLFIPVVLMVGLLFGRAFGIYAALLAAVLAGLSIGNVGEPLWLTGPQWMGSILFVLVASGTAILAAELRAVFARSQRLTIEKGAADATLRAVFENAPVGLSLAAASGESILLNEQMRRLLGRDISQGGINRYLGAGAIHDNGSSYTLAEYPQVKAIQHGAEARGVPFLIERPDGSRLRTEISSVPLRNDYGVVTGAVSVVLDVEERERSSEQQTLLIGELAHRMKNTMAIVQAIVHQSLRSAVTLAEARESVISRFEALVRAQDLLTRADWKLTDLDAVTRGALETVNQDGRLTIKGYPVPVGARAALSFTLVLHELATNALKYGALSVPGGQVEVRWHMTMIEASRWVIFTWSEIGGPAVVLPTHKGFGTRLIDSMGRSFGGQSQLRYDPSGVCWQVSADTERLKTA